VTKEWPLLRRDSVCIENLHADEGRGLRQRILGWLALRKRGRLGLVGTAAASAVLFIAISYPWALRNEAVAIAGACPRAPLFSVALDAAEAFLADFEGRRRAPPPARREAAPDFRANGPRLEEVCSNGRRIHDWRAAAVEGKEGATRRGLQGLTT
jgi:hypothetical protein